MHKMWFYEQEHSVIRGILQKGTLCDTAEESPVLREGRHVCVTIC